MKRILLFLVLLPMLSWAKNSDIYLGNRKTAWQKTKAVFTSTPAKVIYAGVVGVAVVALIWSKARRGSHHRKKQRNACVSRS